MMMRYKPMLAYPVSEKLINYNDKNFMQPKLDGVRCLIQYEAEEYDDMSNRGRVIAYSRTGKEWKNIDHILFNLKSFFKLNPNVVLDGELYNHDLKDDFGKIISCVRKTKPTLEHKEESSKLIHFYCYDVIVSDDTLEFDKRSEWIKLNVPRNWCVKHVKTKEIWRDTSAKETHKINLLNGYEGSILRLNTKYEFKRSHSLRKFKDFRDSEARITGWVEGKGKRIGTIGKFTAVDSEGNEFGMPVMDNFEKLRTNFELMKTWVGEIATFTYFERTKANSYRHPLFKCIRDYE